LSSGQAIATSVGAGAVPSVASSTEMSSGTSIVVVTLRSSVNSSSHRSDPTGDAAGSATGSVSPSVPVAGAAGSAPSAVEPSSSTGSVRTTSFVSSSASAS